MWEFSESLTRSNKLIWFGGYEGLGNIQLCIIGDNVYLLSLLLILEWCSLKMNLTSSLSFFYSNNDEKTFLFAR